MRQIFQRSMLTFLLLAAISFVANAVFAGRPRAQNPRLENAETAGQKTQSVDSIPSIEKPDYSQEPFIIERFIMRDIFQNDGTDSADIEAVVHVQSDAGVQQFGQLVFGYNLSNQKMNIISVEVRKAGSSAFTPASAVQDLAPVVASGAPAYTDYREKHVTVPGLSAGDTLAYHISKTTTTPLAPGQFWFAHDFLKDPIVLDERLEISVPRNRVIKLKTQPGADPEISDEGDRRVYRWKSAHPTRENKDQEKRAKNSAAEPQSPAVEMTTFQTWEEMGRWYASLERERATPDAAVRAKSEELTKGRATDLEKIEALYDFVSTKFRYVSLALGMGRYEPHAAGEILTNEYGDSKDKHTLLEALLEAQGIPAYPALIPSGRKIDPDMPSPEQFDHVITVIPRGADSKDWLWLDTTTEVAPFRLLAATLRGKQVLVIPIDAGGASLGQSLEPARLVETPADPPSLPVQYTEVTGQVSSLGKLAAHVHYSMTGDNALVLRVAFRRTPQTDWKQLGQLLSTGDGFQGEITAVKSSDPSDTHKPFEVDYQISQTNFLDWSRENSQLRMPLPALGIPESEEASDSSAEPLKLGSPLEVHISATINLPAGYAVRTPVSVSMSRDFATYRSTYSATGTTVVAHRDIVFREREIPAAHLPEYQAFARAVRADEAQTIAVETTSAAPPSVPPGAKPGELLEAGQAALQAGNSHAAIELFARVVQLEPLHKTAWGLLGSSYVLQNETGRAEAAFRKQIEINPRDEGAYLLLGIVLLQEHQYGGAVTAIEKHLERNPLDARAHIALGQVYLDQKKYSDAAPELEKAVSLQPDNAPLRANLGQAYLNLDENEKGLAALAKAVELSPTPAIWNDVAYQLTKKNLELERAQQYAESAVATISAALRNASLGSMDVQQLSQVRSLGACWDTLGWILFNRGNPQAAESYIRASWMLDHRSEVGDHLGQIEEKTGRKNDAMRTYALAMHALHPVPEARSHLEVLAGGPDKATLLALEAGPQLSKMRSIELGKLLQESANAEFFVLLSPDGAFAKAEDVRFVSGSEKLRPLASALRAAHYPDAFPPGAPGKLIRRGVLSCGMDTGNCKFVLYEADDVQTID